MFKYLLFIILMNISPLSALCQNSQNINNVLDQQIEKVILDDLHSLIYRGRFLGGSAKHEYARLVDNLNSLSDNFIPSFNLIHQSARLMVLLSGDAKFAWLSEMINHNLLVSENFFMFINALDNKQRTVDRLLLVHQEKLFKIVDTISVKDAVQLINKVVTFAKKNPLVGLWIYKIGFKYNLISSHILADIFRFFAYDLNSRLSDFKYTDSAILSIQKSKENGLYNILKEEIVILALSGHQIIKSALKFAKREADPLLEHQSSIDITFLDKLINKINPLELNNSNLSYQCRELFL